mgnify:CR=1 FL=1
MDSSTELKQLFGPVTVGSIASGVDGNGFSMFEGFIRLRRFIIRAHLKNELIKKEYFLIGYCSCGRVLCFLMVSRNF